jgi:radical SAM protein with 4Fe4S-binding SPASM domain
MEIQKGIFNKKDILKHVTLDGVRLHLRVDEKKLWINGYYVLYLNKTATELLEALIDSCYEVPQETVMETTISKIRKKHLFIKRKRIEKDIHSLIGVINEFARNNIPSHLVGMKVIEEENKTAPNRMDLSLSYECNNNCPHCYLGMNQSRDLPTSSWKWIIDMLWKIGIPQIVFTGGECTLRKDLPELVKYSKKFITGIISNGTNITQELATQLKEAELDWIQITLNSHKEKIHDLMQGREGAYKETITGIKNCVKEGIQTAINMTITQKNKNDIKGIIDLADKLGVKIVSSNALINSGRGINKRIEDGISETELKNIIVSANEYAKNKGIEFNWFLPTCYKNLNPIELGFGQRCCSACSVNMMIEPNGDIIPCQSWTQSKLGNILRDKWENIWNSEKAKKIRGFGYAPEKCRECSEFKLCGGSCPLEKINCGGCGK